MFVLILITFISGCITVGPNYVRPDVEVSKAWKNQQGNNGNNTEALAEWWNALGDPKLASLIERAEKGNLDLKKAQAKIREARARRGVAKAGFFPTPSATGSANRSKSSDDSGGTTNDLYVAGFDASWELDIFGKLTNAKRGVKAALEQSEA